MSELFSRDAAIKPSGEYSTSALKQAVVHGNLPATKRLLELSGGADLGGESCLESPLTDAAKADFAEIVRELLVAGASPHQEVDFGSSFDILDEPANLG